MVNIGTKGYILQSDVTLDLTSASSWDDVTSVNYTSASNRAGRDFYVYACKPVRGIEPVLILSANSTVQMVMTRIHPVRLVASTAYVVL